MLDQSMVTCFNPRSRVGSDSAVLHELISDRMFQSTLPRGERPSGLITHLAHSVVSIHAPAWGATKTAQMKDIHFIVSIHAPAWGATAGMIATVIAPKFQSTLPRGERHPDLAPIGLGVNVSIHAPAWGATSPPARFRSRHWVSIHAPAWGATHSQILFKRP